MIPDFKSRKLKIKKCIFNLYFDLVPQKHSYVTFAGRTDGIGAQIHAAISVILFAHNMGIKYAHTSFSNIDHRPSNSLDWDLKWEVFFGLKYYQNTVEEINTNFFYICEPPNFKAFKNCLYVINNCFDHMDENISVFMNIKKNLQKCYYLAPKNNFLTDSVSIARGHINVSIHIRRGDALTEKNNFRLTESQYILKNLVRLSNFIKDSGYTYNINVFSQGDCSEFEYLSILDNVKLFLDEDLFMTFDSLVSSDILITSKSSFSYVAALLSDNIILYEPFWHPPLKSWFSLNNSNYDKQMRNKLENLLKKAT